MTKREKRTRISKLTPEVLNQLDPDTLVSLIMKLYEQNKQLSEQLQAFMHEKYGRKTERFEDPNQLRIGQESTAEQSADQPTSAQPATDPSKKPERAKKPGHTRNPMPSHLRRQRILREPNHDERVCRCGG